MSKLRHSFPFFDTTKVGVLWGAFLKILKIKGETEAGFLRFPKVLPPHY